MRALILSDIHGNLQALEAVLAAAPAHDAVWNLGDVVGYGASPNEVVGVMQAVADANVRGNHDRACSGLISFATFNASARAAVQWTRNELRYESTEWLRSMAAGPVLCDGGDVALSHGSPLDEDQYLISLRDAWAPLQQSQQGVAVFGHTHVQGGFGWHGGQWFQVHPQHTAVHGASQWTLQLQPRGRTLLNPGSVGQPRDGDWRAAFAIYDEGARSVTFHRQPYDLARAQGHILMAGLPERLAQRLREGR